MYRLFDNTGAVDSSKQPPRKRCRSLNEHEELYLVLSKASIYLHEVCQEVQEVFHKTVSASTICRLLKRYGISKTGSITTIKQLTRCIHGPMLFIQKRNVCVGRLNWLRQSQQQQQKVWLCLERTDTSKSNIIIERQKNQCSC